MPEALRERLAALDRASGIHDDDEGVSEEVCSVCGTW
jgi:hypothetical protein